MIKRKPDFIQFKASKKPIHEDIDLSQSKTYRNGQHSQTRQSNLQGHNKNK